MKQKLRYRFLYQCKPEDPNSERKAVEIALTVMDLPFFPQKGMLVRITESMDLAVIESVSWFFDEPSFISVLLEEPMALANYDEMLIDGWRELRDAA